MASNRSRNKCSPANGIAEEQVETVSAAIAALTTEPSISDAAGFLLESGLKAYQSESLRTAKGLTSFYGKSPRGYRPEAFRFSGRNFPSVLESLCEPVRRSSASISFFEGVALHGNAG